MSLRINHNIASVNGHRNMLKNDMAISSSLEKLSSGLRINRAADDAAGLIISEQMRAQLSGISQAIDNTETAVAMVQTAEGALDEMNSLLNKARELALHAANDGANDTNQLSADQSELDNIISSIDRIATKTQFGTKKILDGTLASAQVVNNGAVEAVSINADATAGLYNITTGATQGARAVDDGATTALSDGEVDSLTNVSTLAALDGSSTFSQETTLKLDDGGNAIASVTVAAGTTLSDAVAALNADSASKDAGVTAAITGSTQKLVLTAEDIGSYADGVTLEFNVGGTDTTAAALDAAGEDASLDVTSASFDDNGTDLFTNADLAKANRGTTFVLSNTGNTNAGTVTLTESAATSAAATDLGDAVEITSGATFQIGANQNQTASVSIQSMKADQLGVEGGSDLQDLVSEQYLVNGRAQDAIAVIDAAIDEVTNVRGELGAFQSNTLQTNVNSLRVSMENLTAAESTIRDVDFAAESAEFTRANILIQASTSMLAQANQLPQNVLQLLG